MTKKRKRKPMHSGIVILLLAALILAACHRPKYLKIIRENGDTTIYRLKRNGEIKGTVADSIWFIK